eukprot:scaffold131301_cov32-Tisochrysis_lutea.AAC.6
MAVEPVRDDTHTSLKRVHAPGEEVQRSSFPRHGIALIKRRIYALNIPIPLAEGGVGKQRAE